jgi:hypothetical protein
MPKDRDRREHVRRQRKAQEGPRTIAPRLLNGECRESFGHGLPPEIKQGLREIARKEHRSMSWLLEDIIIEYFELPKPKYIKQKPRK